VELGLIPSFVSKLYVKPGGGQGRWGPGSELDSQSLF
jgi:hypothetical protein